MIFKTLEKAYVFIFLLTVFSKLSQGEAADESTTEENESESSNGDKGSDAPDWHPMQCLEFNGAYARRPNLGIVCCGNETLYLPIELVENWDSNSLLTDCTHDFHSYTDVEMPIALWKVSLCVFKNASAFPDNKITFDNFFKFITTTYPDEIKTKLKKSTTSCKDGEKLKDNVHKLQKFTECFHKSEKDVCHLPYAESLHAELSKKLESKYDCPGMEGIYGKERADFCCKKQSVPFNFLDFYVRFPIEDEIREKSENCSQSFRDKQLDLDPKLKAALEQDFEDENAESDSSAYANATEMLADCNMACDVRQKNYANVKDLTIDYEATASYMISEFGTKIHEALKKIILARKASFQIKIDDKSLSYDEFNKKFKEANEMTKIRFYCTFATKVVAEVERSLHEYCFDKDFADKWFNDNHL